ncbi:MAG TPA: TolC family protein [Candidatus Polarisedimenticolia bacterium]|nr:TolC family protein [Candidatus Polarisedimenticolia bacterium]
MWKRSPWVLLSLSLSAVAVAGDERTITLDEALRRAQEQSPAGLEIALEVERARARIGASGLWSNPEFALVREESAGVVERFANVTQTFPLTGRLALERDSARRGHAAAEAAASQERVALRARVQASFIDLLLAQERAGTVETARSQMQELVEALRAREREGESSGFDRMRAERELAEIAADLALARGELAGAGSSLAALVNLPPDGLLATGRLDAEEPLPKREEVLRRFETRGDVVALDLEAEGSDLAARAAHRRAVPDAALTFGTKTTEAGNSEDRGPVLGIALSIPILDRGQGQRGVARAEAALARARRAALARQVLGEIEAAYADTVSRRDAELAYGGLDDPEDLVRIARAAYDAGSMGILELLDAYRTVLAVRLRQLELHAAARRAETILDLAIGGNSPSAEAR